MNFISKLVPWCSRGLPRLLVLAACGLGPLAVLISCGTVNRSVVVLPDYPGAKYVGSKECEQCHDEICKNFPTADHARLIAPGKNGLGAGCESCHGPASVHVESGGDTPPPYWFTSGRQKSGSYGAHSAIIPPRSEETVCYQCHAEVRGQFNLPNHHPVPEGRMNCTACHSPHSGSINKSGGGALLTQNQACVQCHPAQRGPYVFEHEAIREGCASCHTSHGSINAKMLTVRDSNLCLKCHFQQVRGGQVLIGGSDHTPRLQQGSCWNSGCHEAVHGSRVSPSLRF